MSRTVKKNPGTNIFRHPKGYKQAIIGGARKGAIPPTAWDDLIIGKEAYLSEKYDRKKTRKHIVKPEEINE
jgi:hypothetical protein